MVRRILAVGAGLMLLDCGDASDTLVGNGSSETAAPRTTAVDASTNATGGAVTTLHTTGATEAPASTSSGGAASTGSAAETSTTTGVEVPGPLAIYIADGQSQVQLWVVPVDAQMPELVAAYDVGSGAGQLALHPDGRHIYATASGGAQGPRVLSFVIDELDGTLTHLGTTAIEFAPVYWSIDGAGILAFSASFNQDQVGVWRIAEDFTVTAGATQVLATADEPHAVVPHPSGSWVYVPHRGGNEIRQYAFDAAAGTLMLVDTTAAVPGAGARHLAFDAAGRHAYLANEYADSVTHFTVDRGTGDLSMAETMSTIPPRFSPDSNSCADVHMTLDGQAVFVSNRGHDSIAMFAVGLDGALTALGQQPTEAIPREFDVDPRGRFLFSAGQNSGRLAVYEIENGGTLAELGTVMIGGRPTWVTTLELRVP